MKRVPSLTVRKKTVVLIGPLASVSRLKQWLEIHQIRPETKKQHFLFIDGGGHFKKDLQLQGLLIGDGDSFPGKMDIKLQSEKDYSDLSFALALIPPSVTKVYLMGFLGGRPDHQLAVWGEIYHFLKKRSLKTFVIFDDKIAAFTQGTFDLSLKGIFSLFSFGPGLFKMTGSCQYQLPRFTSLLPLSSHGLSNKGDGIVRICAKAPFFLFHSGTSRERAELFHHSLL